jgi:peptidoglycan-N-acetylglucosamine deacetylase
VTLFKVPSAFPFLFRELCWRIPSTEKVLYLTFDDGPEPFVNTFVLDTLKEYDASATFFCVGQNVEKHPELFQRIKETGHTVGNHTYSHLKGWTTKTAEYLNDIKNCERIVTSELFRPPYGKLTYSQYKKVVQEYTVVLWDVITHDYRADLDKELALSKTIDAIKPGSVVVFHDSLKAKDNLEYLLPRMLKHYKDKGYTFKALNTKICRTALS